MRKLIVKHLAGKKGVFMHVPKTAGSSVRKFASLQLKIIL